MPRGLGAAGAVLMMLSFSAYAQGPEDELPALDFLEFLGSWEAEDDEWVELLEIAEMRSEDDAEPDGKDNPEVKRDDS